jgi:hypothetical protein
LVGMMLVRFVFSFFCFFFFFFFLLRIDRCAET